MVFIFKYFNLFLFENKFPQSMCCHRMIDYCILHGRIKGFNCSITTILFEVGSDRTVVGSL